MTSGDLDTEIKAIEVRLVNLAERIATFEIDSRARIAATHKIMLGQLRDSVNDVNNTILFLEQGGDDAYIDLVIGPLSEAQAIKNVVKKHSGRMHASFSQLRTTAISAVKQAEDVKTQFSEFDVQLDLLRNDLDAVAAQADGLLAKAKATLDAKESELRKTKQTLQEKKNAIDTLEAELDGDKDERHRLRKKRAVAWASSVIFPPMVLRALSLELDASDLRAQMRGLKEQIECEELKTSSLERETATFEGQRKILAAIVANTRVLIARCEPLASNASETQKLVDSRIVEYHDLVLRTDEFASFTGDLTRQTNAFRLLGWSSRIQLQKSTGRIVTRLLEMDQAEVKLITMDLQRV
ncbi:hypothetical protein F4808DRAFT_381400 [Astrocystis sublimbata]|nr:hypothetical protein F4808DRAFT_381400 [Astrocystis sublimbata]